MDIGVAGTEFLPPVHQRLVHLADIGYWTLALAGGLIKPETVSSKYRRPLVM